MDGVFALVVPVDDDIEIVAAFGGNGNELLIACLLYTSVQRIDYGRYIRETDLLVLKTEDNTSISAM